MKTRLLLCLVLLGCSEDPPTCKQAVDAVHVNMRKQDGAWLNTYFSEARCIDDKYSATVRTCISKAKTGDALDKCARGHKAIEDLIEEGRAAGLLAYQRITHGAIMQYYNAFEIWSKTHPDQQCPGSLRDLAPALPKILLEERDAWGSPFTMKCDDKVFDVVAMGPDMKLGTSDDMNGAWVEAP